MARFEAVTSVGDGQAAVTLSGECDLSAREEFMAVLMGAVDAAPLVLVDLGAVTFLDSSGVHALVTAYRAALDRGRRLNIVNASGMVAHVLAITGVGGLLSPQDGARDG
jgi:anti-sigma B factor antagonist